MFKSVVLVTAINMMKLVARAVQIILMTKAIRSASNSHNKKVGIAIEIVTVVIPAITMLTITKLFVAKAW